MGASVRIEAEAFADLRYEVLASIAGLADADHARGKMARIWSQCTSENLLVLSEHDVVAVLGPKAVAALVGSRLGEDLGDGKIRIRGTKGRIEWLATLRKNGRKGGRPKKSKRKPSGYGQPKPDANPPAPAPAPAPAIHDLDQVTRSYPTPSVSTHVPGVGVSLVDFSKQLADQGICIQVSHSERERYSKLFPVEQYEIDHAIDSAKAKHARCGYVLSTIEGERERAAKLPNQPPAKAAARSTFREDALKFMAEEAKRKSEGKNATGA